MLVDKGEAEAMALAGERGWKLVLDDRQARYVARNLGIAIIGTVGILVQAKQTGIISLIKPMIDDLEANGFHLGLSLKEEAMRLVGE